MQMWSNEEHKSSMKWRRIIYVRLGTPRTIRSLSKARVLKDVMDSSSEDSLHVQD